MNSTQLFILITSGIFLVHSLSVSKVTVIETHKASLLSKKYVSKLNRPKPLLPKPATVSKLGSSRPKPSSSGPSPPTPSKHEPKPNPHQTHLSQNSQSSALQTPVIPQFGYPLAQQSQPVPPPQPPPVVQQIIQEEEYHDDQDSDAHFSLGDASSDDDTEYADSDEDEEEESYDTPVEHNEFKPVPAAPATPASSLNGQMSSYSAVQPAKAPTLQVGANPAIQAIGSPITASIPPPQTSMNSATHTSNIPVIPQQQAPQQAPPQPAQPPKDTDKQPEMNIPLNVLHILNALGGGGSLAQATKPEKDVTGTGYTTANAVGYATGEKANVTAAVSNKMELSSTTIILTESATASASSMSNGTAFSQATLSSNGYTQQLGGGMKNLNQYFN